MTDEKKRLRVLLIDDDEDDYMIVRDLLREGVGPCDLVWADTFERGRGQLATGEHDIALVDFRLGAETGLDLLRVSGIQPWKLPVILLTGTEDTTIDRQAADSGAADYLVKQYLNPPLLERAIRYALARTRILARAVESEERFRSVVHTAQDAIVITDQHDRITLWNPAARAMFGFTADEAIGNNLRELLALRMAHSTSVGQNLSLTAISKAGEETEIEVSESTWETSEGPHTSHVIRDVTERVSLERRLREQAISDPLTGLVNRREFDRRLAEALSNPPSGVPGIAVLFIDLDGFKQVNDRAGHDIGDRVLQIAAKRVIGSVRHQDLVARLGGDEFAVILTNLTTPDIAENIATRVRQELGNHYVIDHQIFRTGASVGTAHYVRGQTAADLVRDADRAMYSDKVLTKSQAGAAARGR
jgi:diguanylate cyclase (GGDEF)-like protein/PAS domain S-box-containing protein